MKDYYALFIKYSLKLCKKDDYKKKSKVRIHNLAIDKLDKIYEEMKINDTLEVFLDLLKYDDEVVSINAASYCLKSNLYYQEALNTLKEIINTSTDNMCCFSAKMLLKKYQNNSI